MQVTNQQQQFHNSNNTPLHQHNHNNNHKQDNHSQQHNSNNFPQKGKRRFWRPFTNILLIILTTFQIQLIVHSHVYLRSDLLRSFMTMYADDDRYEQIFSGNSFQLEIDSVGELQDNLQYVFQQIQNSSSLSFLSIDYNKVDITLEILYDSQFQQQKEKNIYKIDPMKGITKPFHLQNKTEIQLFLLEVDYFKLHFENIIMQLDGFREKYLHQIIYHFEEKNIIKVSYNIDIDTTFIGSLSGEKEHLNFLFFLRLFYLLVVICALLSLYLNSLYIRKTLSIYYCLAHDHKNIHKESINNMDVNHESTNSLLSKDDLIEIQKNVSKLQVEGSDRQDPSFQTYLKLIEFDVIVSSLSNLVQVVGSVLLIFGREHEILVGMGCLLAWMTLFRYLRKFEGLTLMYQLIKLSIVKILMFAISLLLVFVGYALLGMCLFPKAKLFSSLSLSVTTLVCLMVGDSIDLITAGIKEKYSTLLCILYIFSFVLLFMHAIHNTLTSILREYFVIRKMQLLQKEKQLKGHQHYLYLSELPNPIQQKKKHFPLKYDHKLGLQIERIEREKPIKGYTKSYRKLVMLMEDIINKEKWMVYDCELLHNQQVLEESTRRYHQILLFIQKLSNKKKSMKVDSLLTDN